MKVQSIVVLLVAGFLCVDPLAAQHWTPTQLMQVKRVSGVQVSPDGKRVVYAVREANMEDGKSEYRTHIHLANADGTGAKPLAEGDDPQWSHDGKWIAYIAKKDGKGNLWKIAPTGDKAQQLTDIKTAVTSFQWSPDGSRIAFTADAGPTRERQQAIKAKNDARVVDYHPRKSLLLVLYVAIETVSPPIGIGSIPAGRRGGFDWSRDGKRIAFTTTNTGEADDWTSADIYVHDPVPDGIARPLAKTRAAEFSPHHSPDDKWIAYIASDDPPTWAGTARIHVIPELQGKSRMLADTFDGFGRYSEIIGWSADGQGIYFTELHGTVTHIGRMPREGPPEIIAKLNGVASGIHLNATRTHLGFSLESLDKAPEAFISPVDRFEPKQVSNVNAKLPNLSLGKTEVIRWKSKDGLDIEGLLTYPANYESGKRYPLLLNVHGGPMGAFTQTYVASPGLYPIATFSGRGYAVLRPNPRGSSGYGKKFRYANYGDWGFGDYQDCMSGVDQVIKMGVADENRLGIMGWSYGGYMTSWTITQTQRFKAASVGAGVTNLMSFTGTADIPGFLPDYFGGEPWDKLDVYRKHSAMFNIKGVKTPTLIQHGERDERVPLSQGMELYNALKRQGCTTRMVIYPRTPHGIEEPRLLVDCMDRNLEWFDRHVRK